MDLAPTLCPLSQAVISNLGRAKHSWPQRGQQGSMLINPNPQQHPAPALRLRGSQAEHGSSAGGTQVTESLLGDLGKDTQLPTFLRNPSCLLWPQPGWEGWARTLRPPRMTSARSPRKAEAELRPIQVFCTLDPSPCPTVFLHPMLSGP